MSAVPLHPKNDISFKIQLWRVTSAGRRVALTEGTVEAFLATSRTSTATAADPSLVGTVTYTGSGAWWLVEFDATLLTSALLATHFASTTPWCIVQQVGGMRVAVEMAYSDSRLARQ